jgi:hypothetical protein
MWNTAMPSTSRAGVLARLALCVVLFLLHAACSNTQGPGQPGAPNQYNNSEFEGDSNQSGSNHSRR